MPQKSRMMLCTALSFCLLNLLIAENAYANCLNCTPAPCNGCTPGLTGGLLPNQVGWQFLIAPYLWLPSVDGSLDIDSFSTDFNASTNQLLKHLSFGAEIHMEAAYGPWSLMLDPTYLKLTADDVGQFNADVTSKIWLVDGGVFYRFFMANPNNQLFTLELLGGARYAGFNNTIDFQRFGSLSSDLNSIAPIIGGRAKYYFNDYFGLWLRGDVGGFSVDHMKSTWEIAGGFDYNFTPNFDIGIGYRALNLNINSSNNSNVDMTIYGPLIGVSFNF